jgi:hypothetical protein
VSEILGYPFPRNLGLNTEVPFIRYPVMYPGAGISVNPLRPTDSLAGLGGCGGNCGCSSCQGHAAGTLSGLAGLFGYTGVAGGVGEIADSWIVARGVLSLAGLGLASYHGYKRNQSVGWALAWGFLGACFPIITVAVAAAQGFGDRA